MLNNQLNELKEEVKQLIEYKAKYELLIEQKEKPTKTKKTTTTKEKK